MFQGSAAKCAGTTTASRAPRRSRPSRPSSDGSRRPAAAPSTRAAAARNSRRAGACVDDPPAVAPAQDRPHPRESRAGRAAGPPRAAAAARSDRETRAARDRRAVSSPSARIRRTQSPTVLTLSTSSSAISMSNSSSNARTTSTSRAEFTLRSSRMFVSIVTPASAASFFACGREDLHHLLEHFLLSSCYLAPFLLPRFSDLQSSRSSRPIRNTTQAFTSPKPKPALIATRRSGISQHVVRNRGRVGGDLRVHVLAVDRRVDEAALQHQHRRDRFDRARGAERVADHRLGRGDQRKRRRRALERGRPGGDLARIGAGRRQMAVDRVDRRAGSDAVGERARGCSGGRPPGSAPSCCRRRGGRRS